MELFHEKKEADSGKSLLSLIRQYKETYESDHEDSEDEENPEKDNPFLIQNALRKFTGNEQYSDVVFIAINEKKEEERIPAHRMLLAARSPVFEAMLYPNPELEQKELPEEIRINGTSAEVFKLLLSAIYTDRPKILAKQIVESVTCSRKYQVASFYAACQRYMNRGLSYENACELLMCASAEDRKFAIRFIEENCEEVVQRDPFFPELPTEEVEFLVRSNKLCVSEVELFKGIMKWGKAECKRRNFEPSKDNLKKVLEKILIHIRFPLMSTNDLAMIVSPEEVLDPDDLIAVFTYCSTVNARKATVGGFGTHPRQATFKGERMKFATLKSSPLVTISSDGMSVKSKLTTCGTGRMAMTNVPYPKFGVHYFEVLCDHMQGCYDSVGVVNKTINFGSRLGADKASWAVRIWGNSTDQQKYGAVHGGIHKDFFKDWNKGDRIGVKFDAKAKSLSFYHNGVYKGTPFTNVEGEIYPAVEICHIGSLIANFKAIAPRGK